MINAFEKGALLGTIADSKQGLATSDNNRFLREWYEIAFYSIKFGVKSIEESVASGMKWFPYNKGGEFRRWYGNNDYVVNWENDGKEIRNCFDEKGKLRSRPQNTDFYFRESASWSLITSGTTAFRYKPYGHIFDVAGMSCFSDNNLYYLLALCNSKVIYEILKILSPTINCQCGDIANLPVIIDNTEKSNVEGLARDNISISKADWDAFETSWDFTRHPLLPTSEQENIQVLFGMKIAKEKDAESLRNGSFCFSPVEDFIKEGETSGNNEQGDKYEGVFARLHNGNPQIAEMQNLLGTDLETISDGDFVMLRRKSARTVPVFCLYGFFKEDGVLTEINESEDGTCQCKLRFIPSDKMYTDFFKWAERKCKSVLLGL